jgi:hypothetical protein
MAMKTSNLTPPYIFFPKGEIPNFTPLQNNKQNYITFEYSFDLLKKDTDYCQHMERED